MEWVSLLAEFVASVVGSLAWPVVILIIVLLLRQPILELLPQVRELHVGNLAIKFKEQVQELKAEYEEAVPALPEPAAHIDAEEALRRIAEISPRAGVLEAWTAVETEARRALEPVGAPIAQKKVVSPANMGRELQRRGLLNTHMMGVFHELRMLRNQAAHNEFFPVDEDVAMEYMNMALGIVRRLRDVAEAPVPQ